MEINDIWKNIKSYFVWIVGAIVLALVLRMFVVEKVVVTGTSMVSSFEDGEHLFIEKCSYRIQKPNRFDAIVLKAPPSEKHDYFIKRIIGLPNETVQIKEGYVYINGEKLEDPYGMKPTSIYGIAQEEIKLGENEYFVMGDNRDGSRDSREIGPIEEDKIKGRVWLRIWPFSKIKTY